MPERNSDPIIEHKLSRREFVRGATIMASAAVLGLSHSTAHADTTVLALAYCSGSQLVDPSHFAGGDGSLVLSPVRITVEAHHGKRSALLGLSAFYHVHGDHGPIDVPYHAWTRSEFGDKRHTFTIPVSAEHGLMLTVRHAGAATLEETCRLVTGTDLGAPKLRMGTYLLGQGIDWSRCVYRAGADGIPGTVLYGSASNCDYLIITVRDS